MANYLGATWEYLGSSGGTGTQGLQGIQGLKGDAGAAGKDGTTGGAGATGAAGAKGDTGLTGSQGLQGVKGDTGSTGVQGIQGVKGDATGITGSQGIQGPKGDTGLTGAQGLQGIQGVKGDTGLTGASGTNGTNGTSSLYFYSGQTDNFQNYYPNQLVRFTSGDPCSVGGCYDPATYLFTCPYTGYVNISVGITGQGGGIYVVRNGLTACLIMSVGGTSGSGSTIVPCSAGDTIGIRTNIATSVTPGYGTCVIRML